MFVLLRENSKYKTHTLFIDTAFKNNFFFEKNVQLNLNFFPFFGSRHVKWISVDNEWCCSNNINATEYTATKYQNSRISETTQNSAETVRFHIIFSRKLDQIAVFYSVKSKSS